MEKNENFFIENGVLKRYKGPERDVVIPEGVTTIGREAFRHNNHITSVTLPEGLTVIGEKAFQFCNKLHTVNFSHGLRGIGAHAFEWCPLQGSLLLPDSVEEIGEWAFSSTKITSVHIPEKVERICTGTFCHCDLLVSATLPEEIFSIGDQAFEKCSALKFFKFPQRLIEIGSHAFSFSSLQGSLSLPDSVTEIGSWAFSETKITSAILPPNIQKVKQGTFFNCRLLERVSIPDGVDWLGEAAFRNCIALAYVTLPKRLLRSEVGMTAFEACNRIKKINIRSERLFNVICDRLDQEGRTRLLYALLGGETVPDFAIPKIKSNKKAVMRHAMDENDVQSVAKIFSLYKKISLNQLEEYILEASGSAELTAFFVNYKNQNYSVEFLKKIEEENAEKELGLRERSVSDWKKIFQFEKCDGGICIKGYKGEELGVCIPAKIGKDAVVAIGEFAFSPEAKRLTEEKRQIRKQLYAVILPEGIKEIGDSAFHGSGIKEITVPDTCETVGKNAFARCEALAEIDMDFDRVTVGENAFAGCPLLTDENGFFIRGDRLFAVKDCYAPYEIPDGVRKIDDCCLSEKKTENLDFFKHQVSLDFFCNSFEYYSAVKIPEYIEKIPDGTVQFHGQFSEWKYLKEVELPDKLTEIGNFAFHSCVSLQKINLPDNLTRIGELAFYNCKLEEITIPKLVLNVEKGAFANCKRLEKLVISEGVARIDSRAFKGCSALKEIYLPKSVQEIAEDAFDQVEPVAVYAPKGSFAAQYAKTIKLRTAENESKENAFPFLYKISKDKTVKITEYVGTEEEVVVPREIEGCPVTKIATSVFKRDYGIKKVTLPDTISKIEKEQFFRCYNLLEVVIPNSVTEIGDKAFQNCESMEKIHIPPSVVCFGEDLFGTLKHAYTWTWFWTLKVISGKSGSAAETYARWNSYRFIEE